MFYPSKLSALGAKRDNPLKEWPAKDWLWTSDNDDNDGDDNIQDGYADYNEYACACDDVDENDGHDDYNDKWKR